jgi:hypothetical protein
VEGRRGSWWGVKEGAIDIVSISDKVPAEIKAKVEKIKAGLKDGSFVIWKGPIVGSGRQGTAEEGRSRRRQVPRRRQLLRQGRRRQGAGRQVSAEGQGGGEHAGPSSPRLRTPVGAFDRLHNGRH